MRKVIWIGLGAALAAAPAGARNPALAAQAADRCDRFTVQRTQRPPQEARPRTLGELPPGQLYLTVLREVNGCSEPTIVRYGYGAVVQSAPAKPPRSAARR